MTLKTEHGYAMNPSEQNNDVKSKFKSVAIILSALLLAFVISMFIVRISYIRGDSMSPTIKDKSLVLLSKEDSYNTDDIIVFKKSKSDSFTIVKRIVALENDTVEIKNGSLIINGEEKSYLGDVEDYEMRTVPNDCYFVLGDNYLNSTDSRSDEIGFVSKDSVIGKVIFRFFPSPSANL